MSSKQKKNIAYVFKTQNQDSVFSKIESLISKKYTKGPHPDIGLLVKVSDGKCNNSPLMNSFLNFERANLN